MLRIFTPGKKKRKKKKKKRKRKGKQQQQQQKDTHFSNLAALVIFFLLHTGTVGQSLRGATPALSDTSQQLPEEGRACR